MIIKEVSAKSVLDSRKNKTIFVEIKTNVGKFSASAPNGKSTGKFATKIYFKSLDKDIDALNQLGEYFSEDIIDKFNDLRQIENVVDGHIGANTLFALESAALKALAKEKNVEIWELIDSRANKFPRLVGNCVGGGVHTESERHPDFQEFLLIPNEGSVRKNWEANKKIKKQVEGFLKEVDKNFKSNKNDEDAWIVSLNERQVLDVLSRFKVSLGLDVAASSFYKRKKYLYSNPILKRDPKEQLSYLKNLIKNFNLFYIEDGLGENEFEDFAELLKGCNNSLIVGDDLTVTHYKRLKTAIEKKSINAIIIKPNQVGSLLEVKRVCELADKHKIRKVFSHRSGETNETILADLAVGFGADFFKCGITQKEREVKIKRLIEIEENNNK